MVWIYTDCFLKISALHSLLHMIEGRLCDEDMEQFASLMMIRPERPGPAARSEGDLDVWDASLPASENQFVDSSLGHL